MDKIPEDPDARHAFLVGWGEEQRRRLDAEAEEQRRLYEEAEERRRRLYAEADERRRRLHDEAEERRRRRYPEDIARVVAQARQRTVGSLREVASIPVVITKPSDLPVDRAAVFAELMVRLREYEWADPIVSECDEPGYVAPKAIDLARRHSPGAPWLLYMEDDVILGPDFGLLPGLLREADEIFPYAGVVSFFHGWLGDPGWSIHSMEQFGWLQCAAIRNTDYLVGFQAYIDHGVTQSAGSVDIPDTVVRKFLTGEYDTFALWSPSLVQHAEVTSVFSVFLGHGDAPRQISESYKQAYG